MTAEKAGKAAIEGLWDTIRRLRDQWVLLAFMLGALMWLRDIYDEFVPLPAIVAAQTDELTAMAESVARLEQEWGQRDRQAPVLEFPGTRHSIEDARPGEWAAARLAPTRPLRKDCRTVGIDVWLIDARGRWFAVETSLGKMPRLDAETDFAFGVRVHPDAAPGRAQVLVELTHDCGTHRQVQAAPRLHLRVIGD